MESRQSAASCGHLHLSPRGRDLPNADIRFLLRKLDSVNSLLLQSFLHTSDLRLHKMPEDFPAIEGGGSLILAWQIRNKRVLVVGGGEVSPVHFFSLSQQWRLIIRPGSCRSYPQRSQRRCQSNRHFPSRWSQPRSGVSHRKRPSRLP